MLKLSNYCLLFTLFCPNTPSITLHILTLKAQITTAAEDIHKYFFIVFAEKIRLDVSREYSARQKIHMKNQALFSLKDKSKKLKCHLLQFLFGALRINAIVAILQYFYIWYILNPYITHDIITSAKFQKHFI